jgi:hypothetical protein
MSPAPNPGDLTYDAALQGVPMRIIGSSAPVSGTVTCPATAGTAIILGTHACNQLWVSAPIGNTVNVVIGTAVGNLPIVMAPGTTHLFPVTNANLLFCKSTTADATQVLEWMAL